MSSMPNVKTVNLGTNSLAHIASLTMNGLNELHDFSIGEGVMTSVGMIAIGSNSLLHVSQLMMNGLNKLTEVSIGEGSLNNTRELTIGSNSLNHVDLQSFSVGSSSMINLIK